MKTSRIIITLLLAMTCTLTASAQVYKIKGTVADSGTGAPIPYATVSLKGSPVKVNCDAKGHYVISIPDEAEHILYFHSKGYLDTTVKVFEEDEINVALEFDGNPADQLLRIPFGTTSKRSFLGSAGQISSTEISKRQSTTVTSSLEGMVAGIQSSQISGAPGYSPSLSIRGIGSISAYSNPLFVVDGVPYEGDISNINPADVESMTVLKDAAANTLYGVRGGNGVVLITTKDGGDRPLTINFDIRFGWNSKAMTNYNYVKDPGKYYEMHYAALKNYHMSQGLSEADAHLKAAQSLTGSPEIGGLGYDVYTYPENEYLIGPDGKLNKNAQLGRTVELNGVKFMLSPENWVNKSYRNGPRQEYNFNVSSKTDKLSIYASLGYLFERGITLYKNVYRVTGRGNVEYQATPWLKFGFNAAMAHYALGNANSGEGNPESKSNILSSITSVAPIYPLRIYSSKDKNNSHKYDWGNGKNAGMVRPALSGSNPFALLDMDKNRSEGNAFNTGAFAEITFLKDFKLTLKSHAGLDELHSMHKRTVPGGKKGDELKFFSKYLTTDFQEVLTYNKAFGVHHVNALLAHENHVIYGNGNEDKKMRYTDNGFMLQAIYDYSDRYSASFAYRGDAYSYLGYKNKETNSWSIGGAWIMNNESWLKVSWLDLLKLKISVGGLCNNRIQDSFNKDWHEPIHRYDQATNGMIITKAKDLDFEKHTNFNVGCEFGFLGGRLSGSLEYFYRKTKDAIYLFTDATGKKVVHRYGNMGDMSNSGVEFSLMANPIRTRQVNWNIYMNLTHYKNKITHIRTDLKNCSIDGHEGFVDGDRFIGEGLSLNTFRLPKYAGVDMSTGLPMWYKDILITEPGNHILVGRELTTDYAEAGRYLCGNPTPAIYGGFGTSVDFLGFDFSIHFTYQAGGLVYDSTYASLMENPAAGKKLGGNFHKDLLKAWTPEAPNERIPRFFYNDNEISVPSDRFLTDASYLNLENVQFGYTLPVSLTRKIKMERLRIYIACDNVAFVSQRKGLNSRQTFDGMSSAAYTSPVRTFVGGLNITF